MVLWLPAGGGGGTFCGGGGGGGAENVVSTSGATVGGGGGEVDGCSALSTLVPHYGQNFWCSSKSAPQLLQNTIMIQIIPGQGRV